jgi:hypothetical protein
MIIVLALPSAVFQSLKRSICRTALAQSSTKIYTLIRDVPNCGEAMVLASLRS